MSAAWALLLGSTLGLGLWMIASVAPVMRRPLLMHRVAPYVQGVSEGARDLLSRRSVNPLHVLSSTAGPVWQPLSTLFSRIAGGSELTLQRLRQAKSSLTLSQLRSQQAITAAAGAGVGGAAGIVVAATGGQVLLPLALAPVCAVIAVAGSDWLLQQRAQRRLRRISSELPTVLEFISLSLSAGESLGDSLRRVSARGRGEFAGELAEAMREHATGVPLADALTRLERELAHPPVTRLIEQLRGAIERGAPLAAVLQAQSSDVRDEAKRALLESAGRKEITMLVPLVFGLLPATIAFALWPGIYVLQSGF
ncbi:type II secretion system F family protein [Agrococcus casei]|uniref:Type II/IV secretion system protein TadC, associated with Flp pilus assembly n=1 Tax=Agrococcus casei LMG 22410 TaxID=1255656 RepID=A0A1R4FKC1_9MICO|nr:type II secretion system F family protein [Agrococcus casei]SJM56336.1 Type II/IV secretion system protein TadC, associated with Flp pilus assembly [Agrococcus casei LMG 22410]